MSTAEPPASPEGRRPAWLRVVGGAALVLAVVLVFVLLRGDDDPAQDQAATGPTGATAAVPVAVSREALAQAAGRAGHPVYWAGPGAAGTTYELTQTADGSTYVRYLTGGAKVGDSRPDFLTVGSYPQTDPFATVTSASKRSGAKVLKLPGGGLGVANASRPSSWYEAFPDGEVLIEVYAPQAARARALVRSGRVMQIKG